MDEWIKEESKEGLKSFLFIEEMKTKSCIVDFSPQNIFSYYAGLFSQGDHTYA